MCTFSCSKVAYFVSKSGLVSGQNWQGLHDRKWPSLFYHLQIAQTANKLCFPCPYQDYIASFPSQNGAITEYKFTEASGTTVADTGTNLLNATVVGTSIVPNRNGLGYARRFISATDKINCGTIPNLPVGASPRTFEFQLYYPTMPVSHWLVGCGSGSTALNFGFTTNGNLILNSLYGPQVAGTKSVAIVGEPFVLHITFDGSFCNVYRDGELIDTIAWSVLNNSTAFYINSASDGTVGLSNWELGAFRIFSSILPDITIKNRAESMIGVVADANIKSILPINTISLGMVRTNSSSIIELDSHSYKYGRRERAIEGNRKVFLGWKYFNSTTILKWDNPFGTRKIRTYYTWAKDTSGYLESDTINVFVSGVQYGIQNSNTNNNRINMIVGSGGATVVNGAWQTSGYIGCYAEVIE